MLNEAARDHVAPAINEIMVNGKPGAGRGANNIKPPKGGAIPLVPGGNNGKLNIIPASTRQCQESGGPALPQQEEG